MLNPRMSYGRSGLRLTESFESCRLTSYLDSKGVPTIGWGHTAGVFFPSMTCSQAQADAWLLEDEQFAVDTVNSAVNIPLTQDEFDALVDFSFNCGCAAFRHSAMLDLLNQGNYTGAAEQFDRWDKAGGKIVAGLLRRREAEKSEFNGQ